MDKIRLRNGVVVPKALAEQVHATLARLIEAPDVTSFLMAFNVTMHCRDGNHCIDEDYVLTMQELGLLGPADSTSRRTYTVPEHVRAVVLACVTDKGLDLKVESLTS